MAYLLFQVPPTTAAWSSLFNTYLILAIIGGTITGGTFVYFAVRYRDKGNREPIVARKEGGERVVMVFLFLMLVALIIAAYASVNVIAFQSTPPNSTEAIHINVIGHQWYWEFQYPNGIVATGILRIPTGTTIILNVTSADVFHNFGISDFRVKADAIPGYYQTVWISAPTAGSFTINCYELCGVGHALMRAKLVAMDPSSYQGWYASGGKGGT